MNVSQMDLVQLESLCEDIRTRILEVVSKNGGHLSSTLGAVELIVAMHSVFCKEENPFIFDVSHQAYAHKLLTDRWEEFSSLRQFGGISGFSKPSESEFDYCIAGHSSTSISMGVGVAKAFELEGKSGVPVVFIGDGSMSSGIVYEALNELGYRKYPLIIILNDNDMSISKPIGAISRYLSQAIASPFYRGFKGGVKKVLTKLPRSFEYMAKKFEESIKLITPGIIFEELGIDYIGPIDGHNLEEIIFTLRRARDMNTPVIIHAQTTKGKGYDIAQNNPSKFHGVPPFELSSGEPLSPSTKISPTKVFSQKLSKIASIDPKVVGITAAMPDGTGIGELIAKFPDRFWDVAICESHGVVSMAGMANEGFKPFVAIYSTFLQRAYDHIVHDVAISSLPVRFILDRAGIVGEDGETHQGLLDISYLGAIPNFVLFAPRDNATLENSIEFAHYLDTNPCAIRFPRGGFVLGDGIFEASKFELPKLEVLVEGREILFLGYGNGVGRAYEVAKLLQKEGICPTLVDLRFIKPLDKESLLKLFTSHKSIFVFSDSYKIGGVASMISSVCGYAEGLFSLEVDDIFVPHGSVGEVEKHIGLDSLSLLKKVKSHL